MFALENFIEHTVLDVRVLAKKDRAPDTPPGAQLLLRCMLPSEMLSVFDGNLRGWLYRQAAAKQGELDGMVTEELTQLGQHLKALRWDLDQTGTTVEIDCSIDGARNLLFEDCRVHRVRFELQPAGFQLTYTLDAPALADNAWHRCASMKRGKWPIRVTPPEPAVETPSDPPPAPKSKKRGAGNVVDMH